MTEPPQRSDTSFRHRFAELSLEKKLTIFFVPVFAAVVGTLVPRFLSEDTPAVPPAPSEQREEKLEVLSLEIVNSNELADWAEVKVAVRNTGVVDSLIHAAEFQVVSYDAAELCVLPEGQIEVSGTYDLVLPARTPDVESFDVSMQQRIPPGEADIFSFTVRLDDDYVPPAGDSRLYALDISLRHDTAVGALDAGRALLALPFPFWIQFAYPGRAYISNLFDPECQTRNSERLASFLALDGARSDELDAFPADAPAEARENIEPPPALTDSDREEALAVAAGFATQLAGGELDAACRSMDPDAREQLTFVADASCEELLSSLAALVSPESVGELTQAEAQPGWIKVVAPADGGHQLAVVLQLTADLRRANPERLEWAITNVYDTAEGPVDLAAR